MIHRFIRRIRNGDRTGPRLPEGKQPWHGNPFPSGFKLRTVGPSCVGKAIAVREIAAGAEGRARTAANGILIADPPCAAAERHPHLVAGIALEDPRPLQFRVKTLHARPLRRNDLGRGAAVIRERATTSPPAVA
jgi:hypothetical protein